jgi:hypothetical protein
MIGILEIVKLRYYVACATAVFFVQCLNAIGYRLVQLNG